MKNLKTYLAILLAFCMIIAFVACTGDGNGKDTTTQKGGATTTTEKIVTTTTEKATTTEKPTTVETLPVLDPVADPAGDDIFG